MRRNKLDKLTARKEQDHANTQVGQLIVVKRWHRVKIGTHMDDPRKSQPTKRLREVVLATTPEEGLKLAETMGTADEPENDFPVQWVPRLEVSGQSKGPVLGWVSKGEPAGHIRDNVHYPLIYMDVSRRFIAGCETGARRDWLDREIRFNWLRVDIEPHRLLGLELRPEPGVPLLERVEGEAGRWTGYPFGAAANA